LGRRCRREKGECRGNGEKDTASCSHGASFARESVRRDGWTSVFKVRAAAVRPARCHRRVPMVTAG
jgi:hypothetical protein